MYKTRGGSDKYNPQMIYNGKIITYTFTEDYKKVFYTITCWISSASEPMYTYTGNGTINKNTERIVIASTHDVRIFYGYIENVSAGDTLKVNAASDPSRTFWTINE